MSVGIDWTSHPLHSCDDSETCGSEKLATIMRTTIYIGSFTIADVHFFLSPALFSCVPKCIIDNTLIERDRHREKVKTLKQREYSEVVWLMVLGSMGKSLSKVKTLGYPYPPMSENPNILDPRTTSHIQRN